MAMKFARFCAVVAAAKILTVVVYLLITFISVLSVGRYTDTQHADAIVVMGAAQYDGRPSPQLASRLDHAFDLWKKNQAPLIAVTGGKQQGDRFTEAEASRKYLEKLGVPPEKIISEDKGHSTFESVRNLKPILDAREIVSVVIVSDTFHIQRSVLTLRESGFRARGSATSTSPVRGWEAFGRSIKETVGVGIGRLIGFERLWRMTG